MSATTQEVPSKTRTNVSYVPFMTGISCTFAVAAVTITLLLRLPGLVDNRVPHDEVQSLGFRVNMLDQLKEQHVTASSDTDDYDLWRTTRTEGTPFPSEGPSLSPTVRRRRRTRGTTPNNRRLHKATKAAGARTARRYKSVSTSRNPSYDTHAMETSGRKRRRTSYPTRVPKVATWFRKRTRGSATSFPSGDSARRSTPTQNVVWFRRRTTKLTSRNVAPYEPTAAAPTRSASVYKMTWFRNRKFKRTSWKSVTTAASSEEPNVLQSRPSLAITVPSSTTRTVVKFKSWFRRKSTTKATEKITTMRIRRQPYTKRSTSLQAHDPSSDSTSTAPGNGAANHTRPRIQRNRTSRKTTFVPSGPRRRATRPRVKPYTRRRLFTHLSTVMHRTTKEASSSRRTVKGVTTYRRRTTGTMSHNRVTNGRRAEAAAKKRKRTNIAIRMTKSYATSRARFVKSTNKESRNAKTTSMTVTMTEAETTRESNVAPEVVTRKRSAGTPMQRKKSRRTAPVGRPKPTIGLPKTKRKVPAGGVPTTRSRIVGSTKRAGHSAQRPKRSTARGTQRSSGAQSGGTKERNHSGEKKASGGYRGHGISFMTKSPGRTSSLTSVVRGEVTSRKARTAHATRRPYGTSIPYRNMTTRKRSAVPKRKPVSDTMVPKYSTTAKSDRRKHTSSAPVAKPTFTNTPARETTLSTASWTKTDNTTSLSRKQTTTKTISTKASPASLSATPFNTRSTVAATVQHTGRVTATSITSYIPTTVTTATSQGTESHDQHSKSPSIATMRSEESQSTQLTEHFDREYYNETHRITYIWNRGTSTEEHRSSSPSVYESATTSPVTSTGGFTPKASIEVRRPSVTIAISIGRPATPATSSPTLQDVKSVSTATHSTVTVTPISLHPKLASTTSVSKHNTMSKIRKDYGYSSEFHRKRTTVTANPDEDGTHEVVTSSPEKTLRGTVSANMTTFVNLDELVYVTDVFV